MQNTKYTGTEYQIGEQTLLIAPLPLGFLEQNLDKIRNLHTLDDKEAITFIADTLHFSISKNQPEITREQLVNDILDFKNVYEAFNILMQVSGLATNNKVSEEDEKKLLIGNISTVI